MRSTETSATAVPADPCKARRVRYLLDTNIISEALAAVPDEGVVARLAFHEHESAIAAPVWHELLYGCLRLPLSARRERLRRYLFEVVGASLTILPYDEPATRHAEERARLEAEGRVVPFVDSMIAATAMTRDLVLVTRNVRDFEAFDGLVVENWFNE
jgi:tRNA(fMet)-specific endonuclease VapC